MVLCSTCHCFSLVSRPWKNVFRFSQELRSRKTYWSYYADTWAEMTDSKAMGHAICEADNKPKNDFDLKERSQKQRWLYTSFLGVLCKGSLETLLVIITRPAVFENGRLSQKGKRRFRHRAEMSTECYSGAQWNLKSCCSQSREFSQMSFYRQNEQNYL